MAVVDEPTVQLGRLRRPMASPPTYGSARDDVHNLHEDDQSKRPEQTVDSKLGWSLACILLLFSASQAWSGALNLTEANLIGMVAIVVALVAFARCWTGRGLGPVGQAVVLLAIAATWTMWAATYWLNDPAYTTDAVAFDQYSAQLFLKGLNPYAHSMAPSLEAHRVPVLYNTFRLDGTRVEALSYPALSFLLYVPMLALGWDAQAANIVDLAFWLISCALVFVLLPARYRWAAAVLLGAAGYVNYMIGGVTDSLFIPFLVLAVWRWDRYGLPGEKSIARWIGPLSMGLAISVKQTPWFLLAFLLVGLVIEGRSRAGGAWRPGLKLAGRYLGIAGAVFAVINLPFIIWGPTPWLKGALLPLIEPTIPDGLGLINLSLYEGVGGGRLTFYSLAGALIILLVLLAFALRYDLLKRAWIPLVAVAFFFANRSFGSYFLMTLPAALVAAVTVGAAPGRGLFRLSELRTKVILGLAAALVAGTVVGGVVSPQPLKLTVLNARSTGQFQTVVELEVQVTNRSGRTVKPAFTVNGSGHVSTFWYPIVSRSDGSTVRSAAVAIPPHTTKRIALRAPNTSSMPALTAPLTVLAYTETPGSVSVSKRFLIPRQSVRITPSQVDTPVPVGKKVTFTLQLQDRLGEAVHSAGVRIAVAQIVYAQEGLLAGHSSINGAAPGKSPVELVTDPNGQVKFTVVGAQAQRDPVYYQAWLTGSDDGGDSASVPHGYSNLVSVQFTAAG